MANSEKITQTEIDTIIESLYNGQYKQAKNQTSEKCRTNPEKLAYRVGIIVAELHDLGETNMATRFLHTFA